MDREAPGWPILLLGILVLLTLVGVSAFTDPKIAWMKAQWLPFLGVLTTLGIFSVLYKENPFFRFLEHILVGLATGYGVLFAWFNYLLPNWYQRMMPEGMAGASELHGQWWLVFALLLSLLFYTVYFPKLAWMNRFIIGVVMGFSAGYAFQSFAGMVMPQVRMSFKAPVTTYNPVVAGGELDAVQRLNNIQVGPVWLHPFALIFIIVLACAMAYFFFSVEHRAKWISRPAIAGRYFIMIALGAIFGTTVMGRITLLLNRLDMLKTTCTEWATMLGQWWVGFSTWLFHR
jgi:hypothetical protein